MERRLMNERSGTAPLHMDIDIHTPRSTSGLRSTGVECVQSAITSRHLMGPYA